MSAGAHGSRVGSGSAAPDVAAACAPACARAGWVGGVTLVLVDQRGERTRGCSPHRTWPCAPSKSTVPPACRPRRSWRPADLPLGTNILMVDPAAMRARVETLPQIRTVRDHPRAPRPSDDPRRGAAAVHPSSRRATALARRGGTAARRRTRGGFAAGAHHQRPHRGGAPQHALGSRSQGAGRHRPRADPAAERLEPWPRRSPRST